MSRRTYFRKGVLAKATLVPKKRRPVHKGVVLVMDNQGRSKLMASNEAAMQRGRSKGGRTAHERGTRYCWTREQAREAARKAWRTRWKMNHRIGIRLGRPRKQRAPIDHKALRTYYANEPTLGISYQPSSQQWVQAMPPLKSAVPISERTALIRLGHLPPPRKRGLVPIDDGIPIAPPRLSTR